MRDNNDDEAKLPVSQSVSMVHSSTAPYRRRVFQFLILISHSLHFLSLVLFFPSHSLCAFSVMNRSWIWISSTPIALPDPSAAGEEGDGGAPLPRGGGSNRRWRCRNERSPRFHQRHPQLPEQGTREAPRRQGTRQHPNALQNREG